VAISVSIAGLVSWSMLWVYLVANLAGGALAAAAFRLVNPTDLRETSELSAAEEVHALAQLGQLNPIGAEQSPSKQEERHPAGR
jgi:glycerol uptake facilitator-like aquaporin